MLLAGPNVQLFDLDLSIRLKSTKLNEDVLYLRWIDEKTIALVSTANVYHWSLESDLQPQLVFNRNPQLNGSVIINYRTDTRKDWCAVTGSVVNQQTGQVILFNFFFF
jgi:clathrin heavy chain